jgi:CheY-like chemotaxis protein
MKKMGLTAEFAHNGKEAVEKAVENRYQVIFMDCLMPIMDGFEVINGFSIH